MKKQLSENWQLWILMGSVFLALAAGARKIALELEWSEFNANIIFIVSFIAMYIIYIVFHELSVKIFQPMFEMLFKRMGFKPQETSPTLSDKPTYQEAAELAHRLMDMYVAGEVDRVEIIYHHFKSMGVQILLRETYLPIDMTNVVSEEDSMNKEEVEEHEIANDYIIEPNAEELIASLIPTVLSQKIFTAAVDSNASEHAARTLAMQVATDNANELIQDLTKQYNKSRQQAITNELLDIVGGTMK